MANNPNEPGRFRADIPQEAIDAAIRSVDKRKATGASEPDTEVDAPGADGGGADAGEGATPGDPVELAKRVQQLQALLEESVNRSAVTAERLKETQDRWVRVAADFENYKKRYSREREDTVKFGNEKLLKDLLPIVDNLERAVAAGDGATLLDGVKLVLRQFVEVLNRFGVRSFSAVGEHFDPARHEALLQQESDAPQNTVIAEMTKGYTLNDRLVRPAAVMVSSGKPPANGSSSDEES